MDELAGHCGPVSFPLDLQHFQHVWERVALRTDCQTTHAHHSHRFNEPATKSENWKGKSGLECVNGRKLCVCILPWTCQGEGKWPNRQTRGKAILTTGLCLGGRSEVLRSLRHDMRAQSQGHHTVAIAWRKEALKVETLDDLPWKGQEREHRQSDEH